MQPHLQLLPEALWPFPLCFISCIVMFCSLKRRSKQAVAAFFFPLSLVLEVAHYLTVLIQCLFNVGTDKAFAGFPGYLIHMFYKVCRWHNSCQKMALRCYSFAILIFHHSADIYVYVCVCMTKMKREEYLYYGSESVFFHLVGMLQYAMFSFFICTDANVIEIKAVSCVQL